MTDSKCKKWVEYIKSPQFYFWLFAFVSKFISEKDFSFGGFVEAFMWFCFIFSISLIVLLLLKRYFNKKNKNDKKWYQVIKKYCSPFEKITHLSFGLSFVVIFLFITNKTEILSFIPENIYSILTKWWIQVLISIIIIITCYLIDYILEWNKNKRDKKGYYYRLEIENRQLLDDKNTLTNEKNELLQQREQLNIEINDLKVQLSVLKEKVNILTNARCMEGNCPKHVILNELVNYEISNEQ